MYSTASPRNHVSRPPNPETAFKRIDLKNNTVGAFIYLLGFGVHIFQIFCDHES